MEILKILRKKSIKKALPSSIGLFVVAILLIIFSDTHEMLVLLKPNKLADLTPETMAGAYVDDEIYFIYTGYSDLAETKGSSSKEIIIGTQYLIDFDEDYYASLFVQKSQLKKAEALADASYEFMEGTYPTDEESLKNFPTLHVKGTFVPLTGKVKGYYYALAGGNEDMKSIMLPYTLDTELIGSRTAKNVWLCFAGELVLIGMGLFILVRAARGGHQKKLLRTVELMGNKEFVLERLHQFYQNVSEQYGFRINDEFVMFRQGRNDILLRPQDVAWVYQKVTQHRTNGIPTGKTYEIMLFDMDGKSYSVSNKSKTTEEILQFLAQQLPGAVIGYDKEIEQAFQNNRDAFRQRWQEVQTTRSVNVAPKTDESTAPIR